MAGSSGTLSGGPCAYWPLILVAGLLCAPGVSLRAGQVSGDVLVVEHPGRLVLFSKYQQRLTTEESRRLPSFVPMILVRERDHLGDGFTPCAAVEIDREPYYILRDEGGELSAQGDPGRTETFRNVTLLGDTVLLLRGKGLRLRPAGEKEEVILPSPTRAVRIFEDQSKTYVRVESGAVRFGWVVLGHASPSQEWRSVEPASPESIAPEDLLRRVQPVVDAANSSLRRIYEALTPESGAARKAPSFLLVRSRKDIRCSLQPAALSGSFTGSLRAMLPEIERVLGGTGLHAEIADDAILIPLR
jgi:hypothetical protein